MYSAIEHSVNMALYKCCILLFLFYYLVRHTIRILEIYFGRYFGQTFHKTFNYQ